MIIEIDQLTIEEAQQDYPALWATARSYFPDMPDADIAKIVSLATGICPDCHAAPWGCQCENDE